ncbi:DNA (cytosine-5-)-methyltransferase [Kineosporia sp. J2-2]|uniref:DNA (cytosine-5-)-methyltransferase n=1 Tax=Kineosporia corallincola TaxID=2835133 RepID=A0ABS5TI43_9ACTN|nr:DNA (cytosine-5-)-methyltransferase [Kineosporia corallincola]MBT0770767.1 DNA (cytosine-5-)-methyltransferase [Kineosporia corallincola]
MDLEVVEICAGAGGQSLGLHLAGFEHKLAVEIDENAAHSLDYNLKRLGMESRVEVGDVADRTVWDPAAKELHEIALLAGGVPCPPFSRAGKQLGSADERDLFAWAVNAASEMQPQAVLLENVKGLGDARFGGYRQAVVDEFHNHGYRAEWQLLEAQGFDVPQLRPRMVLVALKEEYVDYFEWPEPKTTTHTVASVLDSDMEGLPQAALEQFREKAQKIAPTIVGGSKKHGGADLGPTRAKRAWHEMFVDAHGLADAAPTADWVPKEPGRGPKLTVDMVKKLQGWYGPQYEDWEILGRKTSRYRQIGNAFPPPVAEAVGKAIARALRKEASAKKAPGPRTMHDEVYRLLRDTGEWLTPGKLSHLLGETLDQEEIVQRIELLKRDFFVEERGNARSTSYKLGEWKAFRGQEDHDRHAAFAERKGRNRIS